MLTVAGKLRFLCTLALMAAAFPGCAPEAQTADPVPASTAFAIALGEKTPQLELALTDMQRMRGLMHREKMGADNGMLFLFEQPNRQSFWMKNTPLPLDIGFFTRDGVLREVKPLEPFDLTGVQSQRDDIAFCLEMHHGWFAKNNIEAGAQLDLDALRKAVRDRAMNPAVFGL